MYCKATPCVICAWAFVSSSSSLSLCSLFNLSCFVCYFFIHQSLESRLITSQSNHSVMSSSSTFSPPGLTSLNQSVWSQAGLYSFQIFSQNFPIWGCTLKAGCEHVLSINNTAFSSNFFDWRSLCTSGIKIFSNYSFNICWVIDLLFWLK